MRKISVTVATIWLLLLSPIALMAEQPDSEGWISLFDGKTLDGWKASERPENWTVQDGVIQGQGERSHLFYMGRTFKNFDFKADVKTRKGSNSGIYFHTRYQEGGWPRYGYECQVNVTQRDPVKTGSLYNVVKLYETPAKDDEWWTQQITVRGKNIQVRINGKIVLDYTEPEGVEGPVRLSEGTFAFQQHDPGSLVQYRNVMVKPLDD